MNDVLRGTQSRNMQWGRTVSYAVTIGFQETICQFKAERVRLWLRTSLVVHCQPRLPDRLDGFIVFACFILCSTEVWWVFWFFWVYFRCLKQVSFVSPESVADMTPYKMAVPLQKAIELCIQSAWHPKRHHQINLVRTKYSCNQPFCPYRSLQESMSKKKISSESLEVLWSQFVHMFRILGYKALVVAPLLWALHCSKCLCVTRKYYLCLKVLVYYRQ